MIPIVLVLIHSASAAIVPICSGWLDGYRIVSVTSERDGYRWSSLRLPSVLHAHDYSEILLQRSALGNDAAVVLRTSSRAMILYGQPQREAEILPCDCERVVRGVNGVMDVRIIETARSLVGPEYRQTIDYPLVTFLDGTTDPRTVGNDRVAVVTCKIHFDPQSEQGEAIRDNGASSVLDTMLNILEDDPRPPPQPPSANGPIGVRTDPPPPFDPRAHTTPVTPFQSSSLSTPPSRVSTYADPRARSPTPPGHRTIQARWATSSHAQYYTPPEPSLASRPKILASASEPVSMTRASHAFQPNNVPTPRMVTLQNYPGISLSPGRTTTKALETSHSSASTKTLQTNEGPVPTGNPEKNAHPRVDTTGSEEQYEWRINEGPYEIPSIDPKENRYALWSDRSETVRPQGRFLLPNPATITATTLRDEEPSDPPPSRGPEESSASPTRPTTPSFPSLDPRLGSGSTETTTREAYRVLGKGPLPSTAMTDHRRKDCPKPIAPNPPLEISNSPREEELQPTIGVGSWVMRVHSQSGATVSGPHLVEAIGIVAENCIIYQPSTAIKQLVPLQQLRLCTLFDLLALAMPEKSASS